MAKIEEVPKQAFVMGEGINPIIKSLNELQEKVESLEKKLDKIPGMKYDSDAGVWVLQERD